MTLSIDRRRFLALAASAIAAACKAPEPSSSGTASEPGTSRSLTAGLAFIPNSTVKIEQVVGEFDKERRAPTVNLTESRFGIAGTDLGNSFLHRGKTYFPFGDTVNPYAPDPLAFSESTDPDEPLRLEFLSRGPGSFTPIAPPGLSMGPFEVPVAGISLDGSLYVVVNTNFTRGQPTMRSVLTHVDEDEHQFVPLREISRLPGGRFINMTLRVAPGGMPTLDGEGPLVLAFGSGEYRRSHAYLSVTPAGGFASGQGTRYFAGIRAAEPRWSESEADAEPIVDHPTIGDLSVTYVEDIGLWVMVYDSRNPQGIVLRYATMPWGPWSEAAVIYNPRRDGAMGTFIHDSRAAMDDGLAGPVATDRDPLLVSGGVYAPYVIERFTRVRGDRLDLDYLMSTWNPYTIVRMRSTLAIRWDREAKRV